MKVLKDQRSILEYPGKRLDKPKSEFIKITFPCVVRSFVEGLQNHRATVFINWFYMNFVPNVKIS